MHGKTKSIATQYYVKRKIIQKFGDGIYFNFNCIRFA